MEVDKNTDLTTFTSEDLSFLTDDFDEKNFLGKTQFCKVYRGKIPQGWKGMEEECVTVKIWADKVHMLTDVTNFMIVGKNGDRFREEIKLLTDAVALSCPYIGKLKGFCSETMGVVYDLNALDTLRNLISGETLKWVDRIRILYQFAGLLEYLHVQQPELLVRNVSAAHIMISQDLKPVLIEFGMLSFGEVMEVNCRAPCGAFGYTDPSILMTGCWSRRVDVFSFGVLVLELLYKQTVDWEVRQGLSKAALFCSAEEIYKKEKSGLNVSKKFDGDPTVDARDTVALLELVLKCIEVEDSWSRPSMSDIVKLIEGLNVFPEMCSAGWRSLFD